LSAFYNEIDRYCCDWLQNLMDAGHITPGKIDDRSIADLSPDDVRGYERAHFFAGIAGWELALQVSQYAGPVWTGSCPCQPFSAAGKGKASGDERHLWPEWFRLIRAVQPPIIFGEQVEAAIGWGWLDLVHTDLEAEGYSLLSTVLPACSVGAPHIRQRLWFVADARRGNPSAEGLQRGGEQRFEPQDGGAGFVAHSNPTGRSEQRSGELLNGERQTQRDNANGCGSSELGGAPQQGERRRGIQGSFKSSGEVPGQEAQQRPERPSASDGNPWSDLIWLPCTDGKQRPTGKLVYPEGKQVGIPGCTWQPREANGERTVESIIQPLAHGVSARVAKLRAAGNAIVPQVAAEFIKAAM
jgi:DNA (cytosine-5)-methyltransferase 1